MDDITAKRLIFAMLDADGDGVISAEEYFARAERVAAATGRTKDDPLVIAARTAGQRAWTAMDANGDGGMTFDEYEVWAGARAFDAVCEPVLGGLFDLADTDGDGALSLAEFTTLRTALGNPVSNIRAAFSVLDVNGDGQISREEYLASVRAHVSGEDSPMGEALYSLGAAEVG
ncbi:MULTISPECIES: EF-hand domain-containing protein [unclassified Kitasatospora]|uniref:EF-hand domain-containing protein n=1 Tax=unclassified Kitasatospora TaxID=2633591 RepID=UPI00070BF2AF|nr:MULTISPECIES: EF-hand domain-containing protein [unclassified Kitasatospora]KQV04744.1 calcium-binding protein [Kitasatospora sp. Root107]KRB60731.1 calcium-binding protein [Kitasatospora sp. Root187]